MEQPKWWADGIRFECQGSGKCCLSRGQYGYVYLTLEDRQRLARHFGLSTAAFTRKHCQKEDGYVRIAYEKSSDDCVFLEGKGCTVYEARPTQCRTWPFWPEVMGAKTWAREVEAFCPGVGKGRVYSAKEISGIIELQRKSEAKL